MVLLFFVPLFFYNSPADYQKGELTGYGSIMISLLLIVAAIKNYRDKKNKGYIGFGQAFGLGSEVSGIAGLIFGAYVFVLYKYIRPDLSERLMDFYKNKIINSGESQEIIARKLSEFNSQYSLYGNPVSMAIVMALTVFIIGLGIALVASVFLKRKDMNAAALNNSGSK